jgi:hypothetical protein
MTAAILVCSVIRHAMSGGGRSSPPKTDADARAPPPPPPAAQLGADVNFLAVQALGFWLLAVLVSRLKSGRRLSRGGRCRAFAGTGLTPRLVCTGTGRTPLHVCTGAGLTPVTSAPGLGSPAPGLGSPRSRLHRGWAHPVTSAPGLGSPRSRLHRDLPGCCGKVPVDAEPVPARRVRLQSGRECRHWAPRPLFGAASRRGRTAEYPKGFPLPVGRSLRHVITRMQPVAVSPPCSRRVCACARLVSVAWRAWHVACCRILRRCSRPSAFRSTA